MKTQLARYGEALKFLRGLPLFATLDEKALQLLAQACKFQRAEKGTILFYQSDPSECAYVVQQGDISIVLSSSDGRDMVINEMRAGDIFGELGVLTKQPRSTSAMARANSDILVIPYDAFLRVVDAEPQLARRILELLPSVCREAVNVKALWLSWMRKRAWRVCFWSWISKKKKLAISQFHKMNSPTVRA